jgi:hypothetical protein
MSEMELSSAFHVFRADEPQSGIEDEVEGEEPAIEMHHFERNKCERVDGQGIQEESEWISLETVGTTSTSTFETATSTSITYNTGFGDFCFGRFIDTHKDERGESREPKDGSPGNVLFKELDGFQR